MLLETLLRSELLQTPHAFATRLGGVSDGYYASLNFGFSTGDVREHVEANRQRMLEAFAVTRGQVCALQQVHSARVVEAKPDWHGVQADAAVTKQKDLLLVISTADCLPILFHDPVKNAIAAAHAGWRGSAARIAEAVVQTMHRLYGSEPADLHIAIGPCIQGACYQVGKEVIEAFERAAFPAALYQPDDEGRFRLDLVAANRFVLEQTGVRKANIHSLNLCTHCEPERFYSHRRDGHKRGSHWSVIKLAGTSRSSKKY